MRDPFARARVMMKGPTPSAMPHPAMAAPQAAQPSMASAVGPAPDFNTLSKQMGISGLKLSKDPMEARSALMKHLAQKFGPNYEQDPQVKSLLDAFNNHLNLSNQKSNLTTENSDNLQALLGGKI